MGPVIRKALNSVAPFEVGAFRVEPSSCRVIGAGEEIRLEFKAMQVLVYLVEHAGQVVSRAELEERLWPNRIVTEDAVTNTILKLRRAFGDNARHPSVIETIPKTGYRLIAEVRAVGETGVGDEYSSALDPAARGGRLARRIKWGSGALLVFFIPFAAWVFLVGDGSPPRKQAIAILPFEDLSAAPAQDYFANGITADLITDLSKVSGLLVIAPGSVFVYKDSPAAPSQISSDLAVDYVVKGSVQRSGDHLRINVQLIEASEERALWGERYQGALGEIFAVQDTLAQAVVAALEVELAPAEKESLARRPTASVTAYDHYLQGLEAHGHRTREQNLFAREQFQRAIEIDPAYARAYAGLAMTHSRDAIDGWTATPSRSLELAAKLSDKAYRIDPSLPQVHFVSGQVDLFRRRYVQAIEATQRAVRIDPNYADAYALSAWILNYAGRPDEALDAMNKALRLNPRPTASYLEVLGEIRFVQDLYDDSASIFEKVLDINPNYTRARMWIAAALAHAGAMDRAQWEVTELMVLNPSFSLGQLQFAFPFKDPREIDALMGGLIKAGLSD